MTLSLSLSLFFSVGRTTVFCFVGVIPAWAQNAWDIRLGAQLDRATHEHSGECQTVCWSARMHCMGGKSRAFSCFGYASIIIIISDGGRWAQGHHLFGRKKSTTLVSLWRDDTLSFSSTWVFYPSSHLFHVVVVFILLLLLLLPLLLVLLLLLGKCPFEAGSYLCFSIDHCSFYLSISSHLRFLSREWRLRRFWKLCGRLVWAIVGPCHRISILVWGIDLLRGLEADGTACQ